MKATKNKKTKTKNLMHIVAYTGAAVSNKWWICIYAGALVFVHLFVIGALWQSLGIS